jgi:hypothetical protein
MKRNIDDTPVSSPMVKLVVEDPFDLTEMDKVRAQEIYDLSLQERNSVYEDVHGVAEPFKEEPGVLAQRLSILGWHLSTIRNKPAYDFALRQSPEYVRNRSFCLMFLRAAEFDALKAAHKMVAHFELKLELFGREKLVQVITYDDLDEDDRDFLQSGAIQILPTKDRAGRPILAVFNQQRFEDFEPWKSPVRKDLHYYYALRFQWITIQFTLCIPFYFCIPTVSSRMVHA